MNSSQTLNKAEIAFYEDWPYKHDKYNTFVNPVGNKTMLVKLK